MRSLARRVVLWSCAVTPSYALAQTAPRAPRAVTLSLDAGCPRPVARALRDDLARPERTRVALTPAGGEAVYRATVRCDGGAVTLLVVAPRGTAATETLRGVDPHDLREPLLGLLDRVETLDAPSPHATQEHPVATAPERPVAAAPSPSPAPPTREPPTSATPSEAPRRWTLHLGPSMRAASVASTTLWGVTAGATIALSRRLGLSMAASVERGSNAAPQIEGIALTLFALSLGASVTAFSSQHVRWALGLGARVGAASQEETGPRGRANLAPWVGTAVDTSASFVFSQRLSLRASAEAGVAAAAASATVGDERVIGVGPYWFGASLALGWSP